MTINVEKINRDFGNESAFCREMGISKNVYSAIKRKKTTYFKEGSDAYFASIKIEKRGYMIEKENVAWN